VLKKGILTRIRVAEYAEKLLGIMFRNSGIHKILNMEVLLTIQHEIL
jgi:hypothetical protein